MKIDVEIEVKNEMLNDAKQRLDDNKALVEKYPNMATLKFTLKNWTETVEYLNTEICNFLDPYLSKCDFDDECDECENLKQEQSWAIMSYSDVVEVDRYLCQTCAIKFVKELKAENGAFEIEMSNIPATSGN